MSVWVAAVDVNACSSCHQGMLDKKNEQVSWLWCRFAHMIGTREHADHLWRITKDDNQHSHIAQEELLE